MGSLTVQNLCIISVTGIKNITKITANKSRPKATTAPCPKLVASAFLETAIESVAMYFLLLFVEPAPVKPRKLGASAPVNIDFFLFPINALNWRFLKPGNSLEPTPKTWLPAGLLLCWRARFGRVNQNLSTCAPESKRTFPLSQQLQERNQRRHPSALNGMRSCCPADSAYR